jgi:HK97 family phage portal protein
MEINASFRISRNKPEKRQWSDGSGLTKPLNWLLNAFGYGQNSAQKTITPETADRISAFYACKFLIANTLAHFPLNLFQERSETDPESPHNEKLYFKDKVYGAEYNLLNVRPNTRQTPYMLRTMLLDDALSTGFGFAKIITHPRTGEPQSLYPLSRHNGVRVIRYDDGTKIWYQVFYKNGKTEILDYEQVIEIPCNPQGKGIALLAAESLGINLAAMEYFGKTTGNKGKSMQGYFSTEQALKQNERDNAMESIEAQIATGSNTLILDHGYQYKSVSITPAELQLLEFGNFSIDEICRWFRVPQPLIMHLVRGTGYNSLESLNLHFKTYTIDPWCVQIEQELRIKMLPEYKWPTHYFKHNVAALLRGDVRSQAQFFKDMFYVGGYSPNDILEKLDENPYPGGNRRFVPGNTIPPELMVDKIVQELKNQQTQNIQTDGEE